MLLPPSATSRELWLHWLQQHAPLDLASLAAATVSLLLCALSGVLAIDNDLRNGGLCCLVLWLLLSCAFLFVALSDDGGSASGSG